MIAELLDTEQKVHGSSMAGSRLEKLGTVFSRTRDLMRAGVIKENEKPIWYDVYAAFPPKREPTYVRPPKRRQKPVENVPALFYREDAIRAKFYDAYGSPGMVHLDKRDYKSICQRFVEKYLDLQRSGVSEEQLFEETGKSLLLDGITLRRAGVKTKSDQPSSASQSQSESPESRILSIIDQLKHPDETDKS